MPGKAIELLERAAKADPEMTYAQAALGFAYTQAGESDKAREVLARLDALGRKRYISGVQAAQIHLGLGNRERVFELYEKALEERDPFFLWFKVAPQFDGVRDDPRFRGFLEKTGLAR